MQLPVQFSTHGDLRGSHIGGLNIVVIRWSRRVIAHRQERKQNGDEGMGSVAGVIHGGVPSQRGESRDGVVHGVSAGSLGDGSSRIAVAESRLRAS